MIDTEVIIVGGGPAGSACAWQLQREGMEALILDKKSFPRLKLCAGWITPRVVGDLELNLAAYPHSLVTFDRLYFHFRRWQIPVKTHQHSIRRIEFDHWLLQRAVVPVYEHTVKVIRQENGHYIIDDAFRARYLVGAGGTYCPVYRAFFQELNPRARESQIVCLEQEFAYEDVGRNCHLWFFDHNLKGYAWYVPKGGGYLNVGIGGKLAGIKARNTTIHEHWQRFTAKLHALSLVKDYQFHPKGYQYFLRGGLDHIQIGNAFLIGDAAGLATVDMGEGIGPAVASGILAAKAMLYGRPYTPNSISKYSLPGILRARPGHSPLI